MFDKKRVALLTVAVFLVFIMILFASKNLGPKNPGHTIDSPIVLDPILNISAANESNFISDLNISSFTTGKNISMSFGSATGVSYAQALFSMPKFAVVSSANYTAYGANFTGNLAYTPAASTSFPTAECTTNHTDFTGYVSINGNQVKESLANFTGGLLTVGGTCTDTPSTGSSCSTGALYPSSSCQSQTYNENPTCSVSLSCDPSTTCCASSSTSQSVQESCSQSGGPYGGGSCSSPSSPSQGQSVTGQTGYQYVGGATSSCSEGSNPANCGGNVACGYQQLNYASNTAYCDSSTQSSTSCAGAPASGFCQTNSGPTSLTDCSGGGVPPAQGIGTNCVAYETSTYGTQTSGYTFDCNALVASYGGGCLDMGISTNPSGIGTCTDSSGCTFNSSSGTQYVGYYASGAQPANNLPYGDSYTIPSVNEFACSLGSSFTVPYGDYYTVSSAVNACPSPPESFTLEDRVDYPYYNFYDNVYYTSTLSSGSTSGSLGSANGGTCFDQNNLESVVTGPGSSSPTSVCSYTNSCASCSPSPVTYSCSGDYNGTGGQNQCISPAPTTPASIKYAASCPSPGVGSITSAKAIPDSCFNAYTDTAVSGVTSNLSSTELFSYPGSLYQGKKVNATLLTPLRSLLSSCTPANGNCTFTINSSSKTPGSLGFERLNIQYKYNVSALFNKTYDSFNVSNPLSSVLMAFRANSSVAYGSLLTAINQPFKTVGIHGVYSTLPTGSRCSLQSGNDFYYSQVNSSHVCPINLNITASASFGSYANSSTSRVIIYNRLAKPIVQVPNGAPTQDTSKPSVVGSAQYVSYPISFIDNQTKYGVTGTLEVTADTPIYGSFTDAAGSTKTFNVTGNATETLQYSGNGVKSFETMTGINDFAKWKTNQVNLTDIWNNTSPIPFTNLTKTYLLPEESIFIGCYINGTPVNGTNECSAVTNANKSISVTMTYRHALAAGMKLDPAIVYDAPAITETQSQYDQLTSQSLTCTLGYTQVGNYQCANSTLIPVFSSGVTFNSSALFAKVNLSAAIPANDSVYGTSSISLTPPAGANYTIYYENLTTGMINWTTWDLGEGTKTWTISLETQPLNISLKDYSLGSQFQQRLDFSVPPVHFDGDLLDQNGLVYLNVQYKETTPFLTSYEICTSQDLLTGCSSANQGALPGSNDNVLLTSSLPSKTFTISIGNIQSTSTSIGSQVVWAAGIKGIPPACSVTYQNQTNITVGQNIEYWQKVRCLNNNSITLNDFVVDYQMPSTAFDIYSTLLYQNGTFKAPLAPIALTVSNGFYIPLMATYPQSGNNTFLIRFKIQPLSISYKPLNPTTFYTDLPALSSINVSLSNGGSINVQDVEYAIPLQYGSNATFITNGTAISNESIVSGYYDVLFKEVPAHSIVSGEIYYYTKTVNVTQYTPYAVNVQATSLVYYLPYALTSISPMPMTKVIFVSQVLDNGTGVCSTIQHAYLTAGPGAQTGTDLNFTCLPGYENKVISVEVGPMNLGQTVYVVLYSNATLSAQLVSTPAQTSTGSILSAIGSAVWQGVTYIWHGVVYISDAVSHFFGSI